MRTRSSTWPCSRSTPIPRLTALDLGNDETLSEIECLVAIGFPLGETTRFGDETDPHCAVLLSKVTDLHRDDRRLDSVLFGGQIGFELRLMPWGDGSGVPTSGNNLLIVGIDDNGLLHVRLFDGSGRVVDTDETKLPRAQAGTISILRRQLPALSPPHVLTAAEIDRMTNDVTSIIGQTRQINQGYSGGPVLDASGEVIGVIARTVEGRSPSSAISVGRLSDFMAAPGVSFHPPSLSYDDRYKPVIWTIKLEPPTPVGRFPRLVVAGYDRSR